MKIKELIAKLQENQDIDGDIKSVFITYKDEVEVTFNAVTL